MNRYWALACVILSALLVGVIGGLLSWNLEESLPKAFLYGGGVSVTWTVACATVIASFDLLASPRRR
ncbi:hypothetical protein [Streptomyces sp. NPDC052302]|uniref:hypothetical protein n=1 Tax=Streptomyces sp. NPDC052302 TaxID=3365688 RepID=UPI0037D90B2A